MIIPSGETQPRIDESYFITPNRVIAGDVRVEADSSIWFGAVVRPDIYSIPIDCRVDIRADVLVHVTCGRYPSAVSHFNCVKGY